MAAVPQVSDKKLHAVIAIIVVFAMLVGAAMPIYVDLLGDKLSKLAALPSLLLFAFLILYDRKLSLAIIIVLRAAGDNLLEFTRFSLGGAQIGVGGLINAAVIVIALMLVIENPKSTSKPVTAAWIALLLVAFVGLLLAPEKGEALRSWLALLSYFAIFSSAVHFIKTESDFRQCIKLVLFSSALPVLYAFVDIALNHAHGGPEGFRLKSTFSHPNVLAFYLTLIIPLLFYFIKSMPPSKNGTPGFLLFCYFFLLLGLLILTKTRSAWLVCLLTFLLYGVFFERRYLIYLVVLGVIALCIPSVRDRLTDLGQGNQVSTYAHLNSFAWRTYLWRSALHWMQPVSYFIGNGLQSFKVYSKVFFPEPGHIEWEAHSVYVEIFFELGALGLIAFTTLYGVVLNELKKISRFSPVLCFFMVMAVLDYLVSAASDNMLAYLSFNWYFWFVVGIGCAFIRTAPPVPAAVLQDKKHSKRQQSVNQ